MHDGIRRFGGLPRFAAPLLLLPLLWVGVRWLGPRGPSTTHQGPGDAAGDAPDPAEIAARLPEAPAPDPVEAAGQLPDEPAPPPLVEFDVQRLDQLRVPQAWCAGASAALSPQLFIHDKDGEARSFALDPVTCAIPPGFGEALQRAHLGDAVSLYRPGFRPVGVYLQEIARGEEAWPEPTPLQGPLLACPGEPGVSVAQVESGTMIQPLTEVCLGVCVPVASLLVSAERCSAASSLFAKLSDTPILWAVVDEAPTAPQGE
jgi:hypothetical protein